MKFSEVIRRSFYAVVLAFLWVGSVALAQTPRLGARAVSIPRLASVISLPPADRKKKRVAAPEGGRGLVYLLIAGFTCAGSIAMYSRRRTKSS